MRFRYQSGGTTYEVELERRGEAYKVTINGEAYDVELLDAQQGTLALRFDAQNGPFRPATLYWGAEGDVKWLSFQGCTYRLAPPAEQPPRSAGRAAPAGGEPAFVRAPMPSQVRAVQVAEGEDVGAGQTLMLLEAMKMEIRLQSPRAGRVARLLAQPGMRVERDQVLVELA